MGIASGEPVGNAVFPDTIGSGNTVSATRTYRRSRPPPTRTSAGSSRGDVAALGDLDEDLGGAHGVACGSGVPPAARRHRGRGLDPGFCRTPVDGANGVGVGLGDVADDHRGAGPVRLEAARLDDDHLHAQRGGLGAQDAAEAVDGERGGLVSCAAGRAADAPAHGGELVRAENLVHVMRPGDIRLSDRRREPAFFEPTSMTSRRWSVSWLSGKRPRPGASGPSGGRTCPQARSAQRPCVCSGLGLTRCSAVITPSLSTTVSKRAGIAMMTCSTN